MRQGSVVNTGRMPGAARCRCPVTAEHQNIHKCRWYMLTESPYGAERVLRKFLPYAREGKRQHRRTRPQVGRSVAAGEKWRCGEYGVPNMFFFNIAQKQQPQRGRRAKG